MIILKEPRLSAPVDCPYLKGEKFTQEYFFAYELSEREYGEFLASGWRRFGLFFFRPACGTCEKCVPIRIDCQKYTATKSQRRVIRKNSETEVKICPPLYRDEIYQIYEKHSKIKFNQDSDVSRFMESFFTAAVPSAQSEYYFDGKLIAVGFLDIGFEALSSVYFIYDPDYSFLSPGTFSVIKEMDIARQLNLPYYNLGYWIKENSSMSYKGNFHPFQTYHWQRKVWVEGDCYGLDKSEDIPDKENIKSQEDQPFKSENFFI